MTAAERHPDDPRPSLEERYGTHEGYVEQIRRSVQRQMDARLILPEDAELVIRRAGVRDKTRHRGPARPRSVSGRC